MLSLQDNKNYFLIFCFFNKRQLRTSLNFDDAPNFDQNNVLGINTRLPIYVTGTWQTMKCANPPISVGKDQSLKKSYLPNTILYFIYNEWQVTNISYLSNRFLSWYPTTEHWSEQMSHTIIIVKAFTCTLSLCSVLVEDQLSPTCTLLVNACEFSVYFLQTTIINGDKADSKILHLYLG